MVIKTSNVFNRNRDAYLNGKRLIINPGGTSSSKTYSIVQLLAIIAYYSKKSLLISIVAESVPHLKRGAIRDFKNIMDDGFDHKRWNKTESIYQFDRSIIEFFSADDSSKLRGGRRDILYINEANNVNKKAFDELDIRTKICTFIDFNPVAEFWAHELEHEPYVEWIHSTFLDAVQFLPEAVVLNILSRKHRDPNWWRVYGLGLVGKIDGLIHPDFTICKVLPEDGKEVFGLDFGYSQDPAVLVQSKIIEDGLYSKELFYEKGLTNPQIVKKFEKLGIRKNYDIIIADNAEPKSIQEISEYGYDIRPCVKGKDSIVHGIQRINQYKQFWTEDSLNCIKEQRNYQWEKDKNEDFTGKPVDAWNHGMDARRYSVDISPAAKVLPGYIGIPAKISNIKKFTLDWGAVPKHRCVHYGAASQCKDMSLHISSAVWDEQDGHLYVYHEMTEDTPIPSEISSKLVKIMRLNEFEFERFNANKQMLKEGANSVATMLNKEMSNKCQKQTIKFREPKRYEPYGSLAILNQMIAMKRFTIHADCVETNAQLSNWVISDNNKVNWETMPYCENMLMIISHLQQIVPVKEIIKMREYTGTWAGVPI